MIKGIIFDFNRTLFDPDKNNLNLGVLDLLDELLDAGFKLCLLSKRSQEDRREQISKLGLDKYFLDIQVIEGDKTEYNFKRCINIMALGSEEILVIGDRIKKEIFLGNKLGMKTIWYRSGKFLDEPPSSKQEEPSKTVSNITELKSFFQNNKIQISNFGNQ